MTEQLIKVGYYHSAQGGASGPALIGPGEMLIELITAGAVYAPEECKLNQICGPGWIFIHREGEHSIYRSEPHGHYQCATLKYQINAKYVSWDRCFMWNDLENFQSFVKEVIHAYHHHNMDAEVLSQYTLGQLKFRMISHRRRNIMAEIPDPVAKVMKHLERNFQEDLSIDQLAEIALVSPSYLHNRFKKFSGISPHQYLISQRLRISKELLVTSNEPLKKIASHIGYANTETFCRLFRKMMNTTPSQYRKLYTLQHEG